MATQLQTAKNSKTHEGDAPLQIIAHQPNPSWLIGGKEALEMAREDGLIPDENGICPGEFFEPIGGYLTEPDNDLDMEQITTESAQVKKQSFFAKLSTLFRRKKH